MPNGQTIVESYDTSELGFKGIKVFSGLLQLDVTKIETLVFVLFCCCVSLSLLGYFVVVLLLRVCVTFTSVFLV